MSNRNPSLQLRLIDEPDKITFVAFDTETTGMWAASNQIVELGAVKNCGAGEELGQFHSLVNPGRAIPEEVIAIHGINDEMVAESPRMPVVLRDFLQFISGADFLIAHNAPFDLAFVNWEARRAGITLPEIPVLDSCAMARELLQGQGSYSLENLSRNLGFIEKQNHRALDDAVLVARLTSHLIQALAENPGFRKRKIAKPVSLRLPEQKVVVPVRLGELQVAVNESWEVWISYESDSLPWHSRRVTARLLFSERGRHYLTAFCHWTGSERTFRLDRVSAFEKVTLKIE